MPALHEAVAAAIALAAIPACATKDPVASRRPSTDVAEVRPAAPPAPARPTSALATPAYVELEVEGHLPAVVWAPIATKGPRPVAVATHGNYDGPQWTCPLWRSILGADVFILCPRGVERPDQPPPRTPLETVYTYGTAEELRLEIDAGLRALRARFGASVAEGPVLYAGCSRGAFLGASVGPSDATRFTRLALVEGGHDPWTPANVKRFADGGGERVLFTCGQYACFEAAQGKARILRAAGVSADVAYAPFMGHRCGDRVAEKTRSALPWLLQGDGRWPLPS